MPAAVWSAISRAVPGPATTSTAANRTRPSSTAAATRLSQLASGGPAQTGGGGADGQYAAGGWPPALTPGCSGLDHVGLHDLVVKGLVLVVPEREQNVDQPGDAQEDSADDLEEQVLHDELAQHGEAEVHLLAVVPGDANVQHLLADGLPVLLALAHHRERVVEEGHDQAQEHEQKPDPGLPGEQQDLSDPQEEKAENPVDDLRERSRAPAGERGAGPGLLERRDRLEAAGGHAGRLWCLRCLRGLRRLGGWGRLWS